MRANLIRLTRNFLINVDRAGRSWRVFLSNHFCPRLKSTILSDCLVIRYGVVDGEDVLDDVNFTVALFPRLTALLFY